MSSFDNKSLTADILVVDDIPENLKLLKGILTDKGYKVRPASNGLAALKAVDEKMPDLILLDIMMPEMDGFEVLRKLKENELTRQLPVIFITAVTEIEHMVRGLGLGAVDYINKPFHSEEILARVASHLELYTLRRHFEKEMKTSKALLSGILDSAAEAIISIDDSEKIVLFNKGAEEIFGYHFSEVLRQPLEMLIPEQYRHSHHDQIAHFGNTPNRNMNMKARNGVEGRKKGGETFPAEISISKFELNGKKTFTAVLRDISERLKSEKELHDSFVESIHTLMRAAEYRDDETGAHVRRISYYTKILAEKMGMDSDFCDLIFYASAMHDIGKIGIPDHILLKPGGFTSEEWEIMKRHTVIGGGILTGNSSPYLQMGEQIALGHHERWDGSGYPQGIKGEEIPLAARIMQLADVYDALRSRRPYKPPFDHARTLKIICEGDDRTNPSHFDPQVLAAFQSQADTLADIFAERSEPEES